MGSGGVRFGGWKAGVATGVVLVWGKAMGDRGEGGGVGWGNVGWGEGWGMWVWGGSQQPRWQRLGQWPAIKIHKKGIEIHEAGIKVHTNGNRDPAA